MESIAEIISLRTPGIGMLFPGGLATAGAGPVRLMRAVSFFGPIGGGVVATEGTEEFATSGERGGDGTDSNGGRVEVEITGFFGGGGKVGGGDASESKGIAALAEGATSGGGRNGFDSGAAVRRGIASDS